MGKQIPEHLVAAIAKDDERRTYPWEMWANGKWWELKQGKTEDFDIEPSSFKISAKAWAKRNGYIPDVRLTQDGEGVVLKFIEDPNA